jgi:hypothetical protein
MRHCHLSPDTRVCAFICIRILNVEYFWYAELSLSLSGPSFYYQHANRENLVLEEAWKIINMGPGKFIMVVWRHELRNFS